MSDAARPVVLCGDLANTAGVLALRGVLVLSAILLVACAPSPTQLVVVVDTDMAIPGVLDEVRVSVTRPDGTSEVEARGLGSRMALPLSVAVIAEGEALGPIDVIATGYRDGTFVIDRTASATLVRGETRVLSLFLLANCVDVECDPGETCGEGGTCRDEVIAELPPFTGVLPGLDGGLDAPALDARSDGSTDGGGPDVPPVDCTGDADCDDGVACTADRCAEGLCAYTTDDSACDDGNECTDDACVVGVGCTSADNTAPCPDGVYCNGVDVCAGGVCTHPGDPCSAPTSCSESMDACVGCESRSDCPADSTGAATACDWASSCDESAMQTRTDLTYACVSGMCEETPRVVNIPCTRTTENDACGAGTSCGGWSTCYAGSPCATSDTQTRSCTDHACTGGTCVARSPRTETNPCPGRSTDGMDCGSGCTDWVCGGFPPANRCIETGGTENRSCTTRTCSGGTCVAGTPTPESRACARETDGDPCNVDRCTSGDLGSCSAGVCSGPSDCPAPCFCGPGGACREAGGPCLF